ncbi:MAG: DUF3159 domain-containing protein [Corynebacterium sp.]|uniref:DUF3159 domain-containing protein n=1 Tax=Corynebacterium sp. TaxID=1720 RepID=UPI0026DC4219|nr:DUF3159 domain-containing protein [Corynebacterium sp.]MDO4760692.1 DUF3159 domain-containing protein [Corynebacterium sp.]
MNEHEHADIHAENGALQPESPEVETAESESDTPTLLDQMGGLGGLVSSTLPILVFVPVNNKWGLNAALVSALIIATVILLWRIARKENLQPAISGFFGVGIGAAIAWYTGSAKGYFLYGIWMSLLYAGVFFVSILVRWPLVGVIWKGINGDGMDWRKTPAALYAYMWATGAWATVFLMRFIVQNNFYNADDTNALAIARIVMGWPLTGLVMLFTVFMVKKASAATSASTQLEKQEPSA